MITAWTTTHRVALATHGVELVPIEPGKPPPGTQNAPIEPFNRAFRGEVLDVYTFRGLDKVREESARWLHDDNHDRPDRGVEPPAPGGVPCPLCVNARSTGQAFRSRPVQATPGEPLNPLLDECADDGEDYSNSPAVTRNSYVQITDEHFAQSYNQILTSR